MLLRKPNVQVPSVNNEDSMFYVTKRTYILHARDRNYFYLPLIRKTRQTYEVTYDTDVGCWSKYMFWVRAGNN